MEEKVKVVVELDKNTVQAAAYFSNFKLSDEIWQKMIAEPIVFPTELMEEQKNTIEIGMATVAIGLTIEKTKESK